MDWAVRGDLDEGKALELANAVVQSAVDDVIAKDIEAAAKAAEQETPQTDT